MEDNPTVTKLVAIADDVERARAAQRFLDNGRLTIRAVEKVRDEAIRAVRSKPGRPTVDQLAERIGAGRHIVIDATRHQEAVTKS